MAGRILKPLTELPAGLGALEAESVSEGFGMIARLRRDWASGANRFDGAGEILLGAWIGQRLVGIGGLNRDPYQDDPRISRLRHVYVLNRHRRSGLGRALVERLVQGAAGRFVAVRLSTGHASTFYESLGFDRVDEPGATHVLSLI